MKVGDIVEVIYSGKILKDFVLPLPRYMTIEKGPIEPAHDIFFHLYEPEYPEDKHYWMSIITHHYPINPDQLRKLSEEEKLILNILEI